MSGIAARACPVVADDDHRYVLEARIPAHPRRSLLWLPALGVAARHYIPLADALARRGIAVFLHEWRGSGSSHLRADAGHDWGYRALLVQDVPAKQRKAGRIPATRCRWPAVIVPVVVEAAHGRRAWSVAATRQVGCVD